MGIISFLANLFKSILGNRLIEEGKTSIFPDISLILSPALAEFPDIFQVQPISLISLSFGRHLEKYMK